MSEAAELKSRPCPVCGSSVESEALFESRIDAAKLGAFSYASRKTPELMHHALRLCRTCGDLFASPAPSPEFLAERYRTASFDSGTESRYAAQSYYESLVRLSRLSGRELMRSECCLDVGCGDGAFLAQALADGWSDAVGLEPSAEPIRQATPDVRRRIVQATFGTEAVPARRYSLVTCFQTLSHVPDPLAIATSAHRLLSPGGCFFAVEHDWRAPLNRLFGRRSPIYDIEHLQLFEGRSIRALFKASGFERIRVVPLVNRYPVGYWLRLAPVPAPLKAWLLRTPWLRRLMGLSIAIPAGNMACIGFKAGRALA